MRWSMQSLDRDGKKLDLFLILFQYYLFLPALTYGLVGPIILISELDPVTPLGITTSLLVSFLAIPFIYTFYLVRTFQSNAIGYARIVVICNLILMLPLGLIPLGSIVWLIYLFNSTTVKHNWPKESRTFYWYDWLLILACFGAAIAGAIFSSIA